MTYNLKYTAAEQTRLAAFLNKYEELKFHREGVKNNRECLKNSIFFFSLKNKTLYLRAQSTHKGIIHVESCGTYRVVHYIMKSVTRCFVDWLSETTTFYCKSLANAEYDDTGMLNVYPVVCVRANYAFCAHLRISQ